MKTLDRLEVIRKLSLKDENWIHKDLFRLLQQDDIWVLAYQNIKDNQGAMTPGVDGLTLDGISLEALRKIKESVYSEHYQFQPVKQVFIPKPNKKLRPLGIPSAKDKIVQEIIRIILDAIYEPNFDSNSFGFRPKLGTHQALQHIENTFRWVDWIIEGDILSAFPTIDYQILCKILEKRIGDSRFMRLIRKSLKCGVKQGGILSYSSIGIPQGSIVSPILANIYYHELDLWVRDKAKELHNPISKTKPRSQEYKNLEHLISKTNKELNKLTKNSQEYKSKLKFLKLKRFERISVPSLKEKKIEIKYVRYADDWMLGIKGDFQLASKIKEEIRSFLQNSLNQKMHPEKTKVTDLRAGKATFLGYEIYLLKKKGLSVYINKGTRTIRRTNPVLRFDIPLDKLLSKMIDRGYITRNAKGIRPISKQSYSILDDETIISHFRAVWIGLSNYYSGCTNLGKLQYIYYLFKFSCAMTLAHRHRMNVRAVFAKYTKELKVQKNKGSASTNKSKTITFPTRTSWTLKDRKWQINTFFIDPFRIFANRISISKLGCSCSICKSWINIEMHHINHVRKGGNRDKGFTGERNLFLRKQIPLCRICHQSVHKGEYDGPPLA